MSLRKDLLRKIFEHPENLEFKKRYCQSPQSDRKNLFAFQAHLEKPTADLKSLEKSEKLSKNILLANSEAWVQEDRQALDIELSDFPKTAISHKFRLGFTAGLSWDNQIHNLGYFPEFGQLFNHPALNTVELKNFDPQTLDILSSPSGKWLQNVTSLWIVNPMFYEKDSQGYLHTCFFTSKNLCNLTEIKIRKWKLNHPLQIPCDFLHPLSNQLRRIDLRSNNLVDPHFWASIIRMPYFGGRHRGPYNIVFPQAAYFDMRASSSSSLKPNEHLLSVLSKIFLNTNTPATDATVILNALRDKQVFV